MARPSVIPGIKARLEEYLDRKEAEFLAQRDDTTPTLPVTNDRKVNVRAIAQAIQLKQTQEKYLYERKELADLINCIAEGQGVMTIGSRVSQTEADKAIKTRLILQSRKVQEASQAAVEAISTQEELLEHICRLSAELEAAKAETERLRARLHAMEGGIWVDLR